MWVEAFKWVGLLIAVLGVLGGVYSLGETHGEASVQSDWDAAKLRHADELDELREQATKAERTHRDELTRVTDSLFEELINVKETSDRAIDDLRNNNRKLRQRFRPQTVCVPGPGDAADGADETSEAGLSNPDVEFLIRLAGEADGVVTRLTACQQTVESLHRLLSQCGETK